MRYIEYSNMTALRLLEGRANFPRDALAAVQTVEFKGFQNTLWRKFVQDKLRIFKAECFQALGHPTRIAVVELLSQEGEVSVSRIYEGLGVEQANVSQHLAVLRSRGIVRGRKEGNQVFYSLRDPILGKVLELMRRYFQTHLNESLEILKDMGRKAGSLK